MVPNGPVVVNGTFMRGRQDPVGARIRTLLAPCVTALAQQVDDESAPPGYRHSRRTREIGIRIALGAHPGLPRKRRRFMRQVLVSEEPGE